MVNLNRRQLLSGAAGVICTIGGSRIARAAPAVTSFRIWRKGEDIGRHELSFEQTGAGLRVVSHVDIKVKVAFLTAFRFEQEADDLWHDNTLSYSIVKTNDDGEHSRTEIEAQSELVLIEGPKGVIEAPKGIMTDVCFWNPEIVRQRELLDTGKGEFHPVTARYAGEELLDLPGGQRTAKHYEMESAGGRSGAIWFDDEGQWVKASLTTRGEVLEYELL